MLYKDRDKPADDFVRRPPTKMSSHIWRVGAAVVGAASLALAAGAPGAAATTTISEYVNGLPTNAAPTSIVTGPEANLWFTEGGSKEIGRITLGGSIENYKPSGSGTPRDITAGPEGNLWFTADGGGNGQIVELNPSTGIFHEYTVPSPGSNPAGITVGHEGDLWFAVEGGTEAEIDRVAPSTGIISQVKLPVKNSKPTNITVGREGELWFTENNNPGGIGRLNPVTHAASEYRTGLSENASPTGIAAGPEGDIWFTESTNTGRIGRLNTVSGTINEFSAGLTVGSPQEIVTGSDGNLYFTESNGNGAIGEIAPTTGAITQYSNGLALSAEPWGITSGPDGNVWFTAKRNAGIGTLTLSSLLLTAEPPAIPAPAHSTPAPADPAPSGAPLKPVIGRVAGVRPLSGAIFIRTPQGKRERLGRAKNVPIGTVIDASKGVLELETALPDGHTESATLWGGAFQVTQDTADGMTNLSLRGKLSCPKPGHAHASSRKPASRHLWAKDNHGRYTTHGANSVATVLGTEWETVDSCAGTLTRVLRGKVRVLDRPDHRTVLVTAGHSFLADPS